MKSSHNNAISTPAPLASHALLRFSGPDADAFLQAQMSADFRHLGDDNWIQAAYCSPKGRVLAVMTAWREKSAILTALPGEILESVCKRLTLYRLRSELSIEPASDRALFALTGESAIDALANAPITGQKTQHDDTTLLRLSPQRLLKVMDETQADASQEDAAIDWQRACILDEQAEVFKATQEAFVPQMLNLDTSGAVSFKKGCYPGQEVVARLHYLGKAKQRMVSAQVSASAALPLGANVINDNDQSVGQVVLASAGFNQALISLRLDRATQTLRVQTGDELVSIHVELNRLREQWLGE